MKPLLYGFLLFSLTACASSFNSNTISPTDEQKQYRYWPSQGQARITYEVITQTAPAYTVNFPKIHNLFPSHPLSIAVNQNYQIALETFKSEATTFHNDTSVPDLDSVRSIPWDYSIEWLGGRYHPDLWSIALQVYTYTGGAHGNYWTDTFNYYPAKNTILSLTDIFSDERYLVPLNETIKASLIAEKTKRWEDHMQDEIYDVGQDNFLKTVDFDDRSLRSWVVSERNGERGILFFFAPYEVGAYAEGHFEAFVPASAFEKFLNEEYKDLFDLSTLSKA